MKKIRRGRMKHNMKRTSRERKSYVNVMSLGRQENEKRKEKEKKKKLQVRTICDEKGQREDRGGRGREQREKD